MEESESNDIAWMCTTPISGDLISALSNDYFQGV